MPRILITGGAGFVGYHLARRLLDDASNDVVLVDNLSRGALDSELSRMILDERVHFLQLDLTQPESFTRIGHDFHHVYHLAAVNGTKWFYEVPEKVLETNTLSLIYLLQWFVQHNREGKLCFTSSNEAYAGALEAFGQLPLPTPEHVPLVVSDPYNPRWSYAATKLIGELFVIHHALRHGFRAVVVRPHNFYGPRAGKDHVIPEMISRIREREDPFPIYGAELTRSFCYIDDAIEGMTRLMNSEATDGQPIETVHIGSGEEIGMEKLALSLFEIAGWRPTRIERMEPPKGSVTRRVPDITKILRLVGWSPSTSLNFGLRATYEWSEQNA